MYTLTAIFSNKNGKVWKVTIGKRYLSAADAKAEIDRLISHYRGSNSEIIDYTITH